MKRAIQKAVEILQSGGLVAFPTETVYGLGANARDPAAVARIFAAKGRSADRALTVHVGSISQALEWAVWNDDADRLARAFWPGPLTLVLPRKPDVPHIVTGGQATVGLRIPDQPLALELLRSFGGGVAAPSANRSGRISPTTAEHVRTELGQRVDLVLDGGPCRLGIESSVLSLVDQPRLLRTGAIQGIEIERVLERRLYSVAGNTLSSYQADTPIRLMDRVELELAIRQGVGDRVFVCIGSPVDSGVRAERLHVLPADPLGFAKSLFSVLRKLDTQGYAEILVERVPDSGEWTAVGQRLEAAARSALKNS
jgi:L-threonylcarbamoyladenylate synthase